MATATKMDHFHVKASIYHKISMVTAVGRGPTLESAGHHQIRALRPTFAPSISGKCIDGEGSVRVECNKNIGIGSQAASLCDGSYIPPLSIISDVIF